MSELIQSIFAAILRFNQQFHGFFALGIVGNLHVDSIPFDQFSFNASFRRAVDSGLESNPPLM